MGAVQLRHDAVAEWLHLLLATLAKRPDRGPDGFEGDRRLSLAVLLAAKSGSVRPS